MLPQLRTRYYPMTAGRMRLALCVLECFDLHAIEGYMFHAHKTSSS